MTPLLAFQVFLVLLWSAANALPVLDGTLNNEAWYLTPRGDKKHQYKLEDSFDVELEDPNVPGSCQKYVEKMRGSWKETIELLTLAHDQSKLLTDKKLGTAKKEDLAEWMRIEQTFRALFGTYDAKAKVKSKRPMKQAALVANNFQLMLEVHQKARKKVYLRCGAEFIVYAGPDTKDPRDAGTKNEDKYTFAKPSKGHKPCPNGAWIAKGVPRAESALECETRKIVAGQQPASRWCAPLYKAHSTILPTVPMLVFCQRFLEREHWSLKSLTPKEGILARFDFIASTWMHELGHYGLQWTGEPALDAKGNKSPPVAGEPAGTYGWRASVNLGQYDSARAAVAPEAMSYFASAIYYDDWQWASGSAKKEAEKDDFDFDPIKAYQKSFEKAIDGASSCCYWCG